MSIVSYIVVALALGIVALVLFRRCAEGSTLRLSVGLLDALAVAAVQALLLWAGILVGGLLRLQSPSDPYLYADVNAYILLGITLALVLKMLVPYLRRQPRLPVFGLDGLPSVLAMAVASGINVLLLGIGIGFVDMRPGIAPLVWMVAVAVALLGYLGLMFGRRKVALRPRRWMVVACVLLLGVAIAAVYNATH